MLSFLRANTPRTVSAHQNPIFYEDGRTYQQFYSPSDPYMVKHSIPPTTTEHGRSFFNPPHHLHMYQLEEFRVISGKARFVLDGVSHIRGEGELIQIPTAVYHRFENASEDGQHLVIDFRLDPQDWVMEEKFFRNFFGYLDDVRKAGQQPSIFQVLLFLHSVDGPLAVPVFGPKSNWASRQVSWLLMMVVGVVIGEWVLGYKATYPEYYTEGKKTN